MQYEELKKYSHTTIVLHSLHVYISVPKLCLQVVTPQEKVAFKKAVSSLVEEVQCL